MKHTFPTEEQAPKEDTLHTIHDQHTQKRPYVIEAQPVSHCSWKQPVGEALLRGPLIKAFVKYTVAIKLASV